MFLEIKEPAALHCGSEQRKGLGVGQEYLLIEIVRSAIITNKSQGRYLAHQSLLQPNQDFSGRGAVIRGTFQEFALWLVGSPLAERNAHLDGHQLEHEDIGLEHRSCIRTFVPGSTHVIEDLPDSSVELLQGHGRRRGQLFAHGRCRPACLPWCRAGALAFAQRDAGEHTIFGNHTFGRDLEEPIVDLDVALTITVTVPEIDYTVMGRNTGRAQVHVWIAAGSAASFVRLSGGSLGVPTMPPSGVVDMIRFERGRLTLVRCVDVRGSCLCFSEAPLIGLQESC